MMRTCADSLATGLCVLAAALIPSPARAQLRADIVATGLTQPVAFVQDPSDPSVQVIVQQNGRVRVFKDGVVQPTDYLDLTAVVMNSGEQGLLGFAFAPNYATSGRVYVNFINLSGNTVLARFTRSATNPLRADPASRFDLMWPGGQRFISQPFANHNGGNMAFGPDGYLYVGMGDGGSGDDPFHNAQNPQVLLGKMLRLDVGVADNDPKGYNVPASNPFVGRAGILAEIWSLGLRNPWRWSFDNPKRGGTGALVIADVGQGAWEEIDVVRAGTKGQDFGWNVMEGAHCYLPADGCDQSGLTLPVTEYDHSLGCAVIGGVVVRNPATPSLDGRYLFSDDCSGNIWAIDPSGDTLREPARLLDSSRSVSAINAGTDGTVYMTDLGSGELLRVTEVVS